MRQSAPYFQAPPIECTKTFYHTAKSLNAVMNIFLSESIYLGSIKGVLLP